MSGAPQRSGRTGSAEHMARFCHLCGQRLAGKYFHHSSGIVFCGACATARPRCARCAVPLDDNAIARGAPQGQPLLCSACHLAAPRCSACAQPIVGAWYTFEELLPPGAVRRFCERCVQHRPRCDLCRVPVGPGSVALDDGQYRCDLCAADLVQSEAAVRVVYQEALAAFQQVVGVGLRTLPQLEVVSRRRMGEVRRGFERIASVTAPQRRATHGSALGATHGATHEDASGTQGHHVLGFFVRAHGTSTIYVERALPRSLLLGTLAHELGHAWQTEHAPEQRDMLLNEGFAEWVAHHALVASGQPVVAARATRRDDLYGRGLRRMLDEETRGGRAAVLALAQGRHL